MTSPKQLQWLGEGDGGDLLWIGSTSRYTRFLEITTETQTKTTKKSPHIHMEWHGTIKNRSCGMVMWFLVLYTQGQKSGEIHTKRSWEIFASYIGVWNLYNEYSDYFCPLCTSREGLKRLTFKVQEKMCCIVVYVPG